MTISILEPDVSSSSQATGVVAPNIKCVFLTAAEKDFREAVGVLRTARITLHHAASLEQAGFQLVRTHAGVLLTELKFLDGGWKDALKMLSASHPRVALVLAASQADERQWIHALECGAFDLVGKPFQTQELRRILENADAHAQTFTPPRAAGKTRSAGSGAQKFG